MEVKTVLLTGGSSGIGAATARILASAGMKVYAGSRRGTVDTPCEGVIPIKLDVNDQAMTEAAVADIVAREGHLDAVICNAGNGVYGPIEGTLEEEARAQLETTFFGSLKTIEACLPTFRRQGYGRIITVTSVMAILELPYQGLYVAAKSALLRLTETLSMELMGSGIECCSILPGDVSTGFTQARHLNKAALDESSPYKESIKRNLAKIEHDEKNGMRPEAIGKVILRQLRRRHMKVRVIPRLDYKLVGFAVRICPEKLKLAIVRALYF